MLPRIDGTEILKRVRAKGNNTPILMLTAKNTIPDKVLGLNSGADDYMTKPFDADELLARVGALTRRTSLKFRLQAEILSYFPCLNFLRC